MSEFHEKKTKFNFLSSKIYAVSNMATPTMKVQLHSFGTVIAKLFTDDEADFEFQFTVYGNELKILRVHKKLLSMMSPVFEAMFGENWNTRNRIQIEDVSYASFKEFLNVFYKNEVEITENNVGEMLHLSDKYDIAELKPSCEQFLIEHLTMGNCIDFLNFASLYDIFELKLKCEGMIGDNTKTILGGESFERCTIKSLMEILKMEAMDCAENELFNFSIEWAKKQCQQNGFDSADGNKLREVLGPCFEWIRFREMTQDEFIECVESFDDMFSKTQIFAFLKHFNGGDAVINGRQSIYDD